MVSAAVVLDSAKLRWTMQVLRALPAETKVDGLPRASSLNSDGALGFLKASNIACKSMF